MEEGGKPGFGWGAKIVNDFIPSECDAAGMKGMIGQDEAVAVLWGEAAFDHGQIGVFIAAVDFVAYDTMAEMCEVDADLVFAASERGNPQQSEGLGGRCLMPDARCRMGNAGRRNGLMDWWMVGLGREPLIPGSRGRSPHHFGRYFVR